MIATPFNSTVAQQFHASSGRWAGLNPLHLRPGLIWLICLIFVGAEFRLAAADPYRLIQYRGPIPLLGQGSWGKVVEIRFELYRSPSGGVPFWSEMRKVPVATNGWVSVDLGEVTALPDEAFSSAFRFLSIWHQGVELIPRKQVASVAYIAVNPAVYNLDSAPRTPVADSVNRAQGDGTLVNTGTFSIEKFPRKSSSWLEAVQIARNSGASLPTFEEWYSAYDGQSGKQLEGMTGHYEWVVPWVYEPAIHARLHEHYRAKSVACYYDELSPMNAYPFRLVRRSQPPPSEVKKHP